MEFIQSLQDNTVFLGLFGSMLIGSLIYALKASPKHLFDWFLRTFTVKVTINSNDEVFYWVNEWLANHAYAKKARSLRVSPKPDDESQWTIAPGLGTHYFWDNGPVIITRSLDEGKGFADRKNKESFEITTFTRSQSKVRKIIADSKDEKEKKSKDLVSFYTWDYGWVPVIINRFKRSWNTVYLPKEQKDQLVDDIRWFLDNENWFRQRGIPYRQGFLLYGPPGTGKSTIVTALASLFNRSVCILTPNTLKSDDQLLGAFQTLPKNAILLIEDVDCILPSKKRDKKKKSESNKLDDNSDSSLTLSGMLNAIDGVTTSEGHILIMTTNHIDKMDPALIREGRVNKKIEVGLMKPELVKEMVKQFFPDNPLVLKQIESEINGKLKSPAYWQRRMMDLHEEGSVSQPTDHIVERKVNVTFSKPTEPNWPIVWKSEHVYTLGDSAVPLSKKPLPPPPLSKAMQSSKRGK